MWERVGDVAAMPLPGGGFGACQVTVVAPTLVTVHALHWWSAEPPTLDQLRGVGPLIQTPELEALPEP